MSLSQHMIGETPKNPFLPSHRAQVATPKWQVNIQQDPSEVSEGSYELAIEAVWWRPSLRSRKRGGGAATPLIRQLGRQKTPQYQIYPKNHETNRLQ